MTGYAHDDNIAAWLPGLRRPLEVRSAGTPEPGRGQIVIRARAVAVNPLDWIIQSAGNLAYRWLRYPTVLGTDVAGEVAAVGTGVTRFKVGDRVIGFADGTDKDTNAAARGAFQRYVVVLERLACPISDALPYERAAVLPMAVSTASSALFQTDFLGLQLPCAEPEPRDQALLVWGGSTSVGSNAIQLAVAAGYQVITTASPHNHDYVRSLGAHHAFDYNQPDVTEEICSVLDGHTFAGAMAIGTTAARHCLTVASRSTGRRFVAIATPPVSFAGLANETGRRAETRRVVRRLVLSNIGLQLRARTRRVTLKYIWGSSLKHNEVSHAIFGEFLPAALADGRYRTVPEPLVVGTDYSALQHALDTQRNGVSAQKVVVTLP